VAQAEFITQGHSAVWSWRIGQVNPELFAESSASGCNRHTELKVEGTANMGVPPGGETRSRARAPRRPIARPHLTMTHARGGGDSSWAARRGFHGGPSVNLRPS
jgi:hypothetical protein